MVESVDATDDVDDLPLVRFLRSRTVTKCSGLNDAVFVNKTAKKIKRSK